MKTFVRKPLITEKTMQRANTGWYAFQADISADKNKVRKEIEALYGVSAVKVRSCLMHGKVTRVGRKSTVSKKSDWKKVFIKLKAGQTIDAFQIGGPKEAK